MSNFASDVVPASPVRRQEGTLLWIRDRSMFHLYNWAALRLSPPTSLRTSRGRATGPERLRLRIIPASLIARDLRP